MASPCPCMCREGVARLALLLVVTGVVVVGVVTTEATGAARPKSFLDLVITGAGTTATCM